MTTSPLVPAFVVVMHDRSGAVRTRKARSYAEAVALRDREAFEHAWIFSDGWRPERLKPSAPRPPASYADPFGAGDLDPSP